ncbi:hypothetical protein BDW68DRAFT_177412 [Aspergillus falconensis]
MVFESEEKCLLPPLVNFNVYFAHPDKPLSDVKELRDDLTAMHDQILRDCLEDIHFRLDVHFLTNASHEGCLTHYQAEKAVRGDSLTICQEAEERLDANLSPPR